MFYGKSTYVENSGGGRGADSYYEIIDINDKCLLIDLRKYTYNKH